MKTLTNAAGLKVFALGLVLGLIVVAGITPPRAHADFGTDIVCFVFTNLNTIGSPLPPLNDGSCPGGSTATPVASLTVTASVSGGSKSVGDFNLYLNGVGITSGVATTTFVGSYTVSTSHDSQYDVVFGGNCDSSGHVTLTAGSHKSCTITFVCNAPTGGGNGGGGNGGGGTHATSSDLSITKTAGSSTPAPGQNVTYTLLVHNSGPDAADHISVTDQLPANLTYVSDTSGGSFSTTTGVWFLGALGTTSDATLSIVAQVGTTSVAAITNTASVASSNTTDANTGNNTSSVTVTPTVPSTGGGGGNGNGGGVTTASGGGSSSGGSSNTVSGGGGSGPVYGTGGGGGIVLGTSTEATCVEYLQNYLHIGRKNDVSQVVKLQSFLNDQMQSKLPVTGFFGTRTFAAVELFQLRESATVLAPWVPYGLPNAQTPTGYVYKTTRHRINEIMCPSLNAPMPILP